MRAMQKVLRRDNVDFRSEEQREALYTIVSGNQTTPLVVMLSLQESKVVQVLHLQLLLAVNLDVAQWHSRY